MTKLHSVDSATRPSRQDVEQQLDALFRLDDERAGELLLVRHASPAGSRDGEPPPDPMLSCGGLEQAERLADRLGDLWVEAVYTAPERRAFQTAKIVADLTQRPLKVLDALADIDFDPDGAAASADYRQRFAMHPRWESLPGFADGKAFRRRAIQTIDAIVAAHPARRVVVVTHSSVINAYLSMILAIPRDQFFAPDHASISTVRHQDDVYAVRSLNDTAHLLCGQLHEQPALALTARSLPLTNR